MNIHNNGNNTNKSVAMFVKCCRAAGRPNEHHIHGSKIYNLLLLNIHWVSFYYSLPCDKELNTSLPHRDRLHRPNDLGLRPVGRPEQPATRRLPGLRLLQVAHLHPPPTLTTRRVALLQAGRPRPNPNEFPVSASGGCGRARRLMP